MILRPTLLAAILLGLAAHAAAAEPHDTLIFRPAPPQALVGSTLPLMAWGPGTLTASPAVMGRLFPPTLIMQQQSALSLSDAQQENIKAELREFQSSVVDVQWDLQSAQGELEALLGKDRIDADAAATAIDRVLSAENALKKLHLTLLIRIRNLLEPEQINKLEARFSGVHGVSMDPPAPPPLP